MLQPPPSHDWSPDGGRDRGHPYAWRTWWRVRLPWFLIRLGVAGKGEDCASVGAWHRHYNRDGETSGCYHCHVVKNGRLWKHGVAWRGVAADTVADDRATGRAGSSSLRYFRREWREPRGDAFDAWGTSVLWFECEPDGSVVRQIEHYADGHVLKYDRTHLDDRYGGLADQAMDLEEFARFEITRAEFEAGWKGLEAHNRPRVERPDHEGIAPELRVFQWCASTGESIDSASPFATDRDTAIGMALGALFDVGDFFGCIDVDGVTLQFMIEPDGTIRAEVPVPERRGAWCRVIATVAELERELVAVRIPFSVPPDDRYEFESW